MGTMRILVIYRMIPHVEKYDFFTFVIKKLEKNSIPPVYRKTPLPFKLAMQLVRIETRIKGITPEKLDVLIDQPL